MKGFEFSKYRDHIYRDFIPRDQPVGYVGPRFTNQEANDPNMVYRNMIRQGRLIPDGTMRWTRDAQASAIDHGFFLHRSWPSSFVNILSMPKVKGIYLDDDPISHKNGDISIEYLRRMEFETRSQCDPIFDAALRFITQQDRYGWTNAWEHGCDLANKYLRWYRVIKAARSTNANAIRITQAAAAQRARSSKLHLTRWSYFGMRNRTP